MPAKVKGSALRPLVEWFAVTCSEQVLQDVGASLSSEFLHEVRLDAPALGILPAGWYTELLATELGERLLEHTSDLMPETVALRKIGEVMIDRSLGRISRAAIEWFASPETVVRSAGFFWRLYHDTGTAEARLEGSSITGIVRGWGEHGETWCKITNAAAFRALELTGCANPRMTAHQCGRGAGDCITTYAWG